MRKFLIAAAMVAASIPALAIGAHAGGLGPYSNPAAETNGVWRFEGASEKAVATDRARFKEELDGGAYRQWQVNQNTVVNQNIGLMCTNTSAGTATTTENSGGSTDIEAPNKAPVTAIQTCVAK